MASHEFTGNVKSFNPEKGYGFIQCSETQLIYGKDILFQKSEVERIGGRIGKGDVVRFSVTQGKNGVIAVGLVLEEVEKGGGMPTGDEFFGSFKSFNPEKGYGFIACDATFQIYQKDIIVLKSELQGLEPSRGAQVSFCVTQGQKGPIAVNVRLQDVVPLRGAFGWESGPQNPHLSQMTQMDQLYSKLQQMVASNNRGQGVKRKFQEAESSFGNFVGAIKSFNIEKGWGFIQCDQTQSMYGKDIFVLKSEFPDGVAEPGQVVSFTVTQGLKGPTAVNVQSRGVQPMRQMNAGLRPPAAEEKICGVIKSFDLEKGYGFVTGEAIMSLYGKDVYITKAALDGQAVQAGDQVTFMVKMGTKGPMADKPGLMPFGAFVSEGRAGHIFSGVVKSYNVEKGWGFITSPEATQWFGKDIFLRRYVLGKSEPPSAGDQVQFTVQLGTGGKAEVASIVSTELLGIVPVS